MKRITEIALNVLTPNQFAAWELHQRMSQREAAYTLDIARSTLVDRIDNADRILRKHGIHKTPSGNYYLEETA